MPKGKIPTGIFNIHIDRFRPLGIVPITAQITMNKNSDKNVFSFQAQRISINLPKNDNSALMVFRMITVGYIFVGIVFSNVYGQNEHRPKINIKMVNNKKDPGMKRSQMRVKTYRAIDPSLYDYVILVQKSETAEIGIIDPDIETDAGA